MIDEVHKQCKVPLITGWILNRNRFMDRGDGQDPNYKPFKLHFWALNS